MGLGNNKGAVKCNGCKKVEVDKDAPWCHDCVRKAVLNE